MLNEFHDTDFISRHPNNYPFTSPSFFRYMPKTINYSTRYNQNYSMHLHLFKKKDHDLI